jgi:hypothetical protein
VLYLTEGKKANQYWNIPIANTTVILLGTGTADDADWQSFQQSQKQVG